MCLSVPQQGFCISLHQDRTVGLTLDHRSYFLINRGKWTYFFSTSEEHLAQYQVCFGSSNSCLLGARKTSLWKGGRLSKWGVVMVYMIICWAANKFLLLWKVMGDHKGKWISVSLRPVWSTEQIPDEPGHGVRPCMRNKNKSCIVSNDLYQWGFL